MWQEDKFIFRIQPDETHYFVWLAIGLLVYHFLSGGLSFKSGCRFGFPSGSSSEPRSGIGTVAAALLFGLASSLKWHFSGFILASALFISVALAWREPIHALSATVILFICRPWEVVQANEWWLQLPRWSITVWLLSRLRKTASDDSALLQLPAFSKGWLLLFLMPLWALVTVSFSRDPAGSFQYYSETLFRAVVLVFIIILTVKNSEHVRQLSAAFATGVATLSIFSVWRFQGFDQPLALPFIDNSHKPDDRRLEAVGSLGNSNDIAAVVLIPLGMLWPLIFSGRKKTRTRLFSTAVALVLLATIKASQSRGALIACVAQCGLYFVARSRHPKRLAFAVLAVLSLVAPFASRFMGRDSDDLDASTESRMNYYVTGIRMAIYSPVWGQGFGRYPYEFERYSTATLHEWGLRTAHSSWILVLAETGFTGLFIFTAIHVRMFSACWALREKYCGLLLALSGYSVTILFLSHSWLMFPWILFALIESAKSTRTNEGAYAKPEQTSV